MFPAGRQWLRFLDVLLLCLGGLLVALYSDDLKHLGPPEKTDL